MDKIGKEQEIIVNGKEVTRGVVIEGLDVVDVLKFVGQKNRKFLAVALKELEDIHGGNINSNEYKRSRKLILDTVNNYTRSILRVIFGDIESLVENANKDYNQSRKS